MTECDRLAGAMDRERAFDSGFRVVRVPPATREWCRHRTVRCTVLDPRSSKPETNENSLNPELGRAHSSWFAVLVVGDAEGDSPDRPFARERLAEHRVRGVRKNRSLRAWWAVTVHVPAR